MADTVVGANPDPHASGPSLVEGDPNRRDFIHIAASVAALGAVGALAWPFIDQMNPAGDTLALASIEFDLTKVASGQQVTVKWRGKPLFVRNRTPDEIVRAVKDDGASMRDPQKDADRVKPGKAEWLVLVGTCTHLGCLPKQRFGAGELYPSWPGGFFCPCHGSRFDLAGRVFDGSPASINLRVPPYSYPNPHTLLVGADEKGAA